MKRPCIVPFAVLLLASCRFEPPNGPLFFGIPGDAGSILVTVRDTAGNGVPGVVATVQFTAPDGSAAKSSGTTNARGQTYLNFIPAGRRVVTLTVPLPSGFTLGPMGPEQQVEVIAEKTVNLDFVVIRTP